MNIERLLSSFLVERFVNRHGEGTASGRSDAEGDGARGFDAVLSGMIDNASGSVIGAAVEPGAEVDVGSDGGAEPEVASDTDEPGEAPPESSTLTGLPVFDMHWRAQAYSLPLAVPDSSGDDAVDPVTDEGSKPIVNEDASSATASIHGEDESLRTRIKSSMRRMTPGSADDVERSASAAAPMPKASSASDGESFPARIDFSAERATAVHSEVIASEAALPQRALIDLGPELQSARMPSASGSAMRAGDSSFGQLAGAAATMPRASIASDSVSPRGQLVSPGRGTLETADGSVRIAIDVAPSWNSSTDFDRDSSRSRKELQTKDVGTSAQRLEGPVTGEDSWRLPGDKFETPRDDSRAQSASESILGGSDTRDDVRAERRPLVISTGESYSVPSSDGDAARVNYRGEEPRGQSTIEARGSGNSVKVVALDASLVTAPSATELASDSVERQAPFEPRRSTAARDDRNLLRSDRAVTFEGWSARIDTGSAPGEVAFAEFAASREGSSPARAHSGRVSIEPLVEHGSLSSDMREQRNTMSESLAISAPNDASVGPLGRRAAVGVTPKIVRSAEGPDALGLTQRDATTFTFARTSDDLSTRSDVELEADEAIFDRPDVGDASMQGAISSSRIVVPRPAPDRLQFSDHEQHPADIVGPEGGLFAHSDVQREAVGTTSRVTETSRHGATSSDRRADILAYLAAIADETTSRSVPTVTERIEEVGRGIDPATSRADEPLVGARVGRNSTQGPTVSSEADAPVSMLIRRVLSSSIEPLVPAETGAYLAKFDEPALRRLSSGETDAMARITASAEGVAQVQRTPGDSAGDERSGDLFDAPSLSVKSESVRAIRVDADMGSVQRLHADERFRPRLDERILRESTQRNSDRAAFSSAVRGAIMSTPNQASNSVAGDGVIAASRVSNEDGVSASSLVDSVNSIVENRGTRGDESSDERFSDHPAFAVLEEQKSAVHDASLTSIDSTSRDHAFDRGDEELSSTSVSAPDALVESVLDADANSDEPGPIGALTILAPGAQVSEKLAELLVPQARSLLASTHLVEASPFPSAASPLRAQAVEEALRPSVAAKVVTIELQPASLGTVVVKMKLAHSAINMKISVESSEALHRLDSTRDRLVDAMQSSGCTIDSCTIQIVQPNSDAMQGRATADGGGASLTQSNGEGTGREEQSVGREGAGYGGQGGERGRKSDDNAKDPASSLESRRVVDRRGGDVYL